MFPPLAMPAKDNANPSNEAPLFARAVWTFVPRWSARGCRVSRPDQQ